MTSKRFLTILFILAALVVGSVVAVHFLQHKKAKCSCCGTEK